MLGEHGFLALTVPEEYGGLGENHVAYAMTCETVARYGCASTAMCYVMHMGAVNAIMLRPTDELIERYIKPLGTGKIGTLSYSDPETGSHFWYPISSGAERVNGGYKVRKKASWTTSAGFADFYVVQTTSPGLLRLRRPVRLRDRRRRRPGAARALGRARPAREPVRPARGAGRRGARGAARRPGRRRRRLERRVRGPVVPDRLLVRLERHRDGGRGHRQAPHDAQAPRGRRAARRGLPDDPGLLRRGDRGHERLPRLRPLGGEGDGRRDRRQHEGARPGRDGAGGLPPLGLADQVRGREERRARRGQDAPRVRRLRLQARHGARALPPRREGRLGHGPDERGAAPVRRQGRAPRLRRRSTTGTRRSTAARSRTR